MSPRSSYGSQAMTPAERVRRTRWANRVEDKADGLLELLNDAPDPLPRAPQVPLELIEKLKPFAVGDRSEGDGDTPKRVLQPGNGFQAANKKKAIRFVTKHFQGEQIDGSTVKVKGLGTCHVAAYTHDKGAMISAPNRGKGEFGERPWHHQDHIIMFRDIGDGRCRVYVSKIAPLFEKRTIGKGGVTWENIEDLCDRQIEFKAKAVLKEIG